MLWISIGLNADPDPDSGNLDPQHVQLIKVLDKDTGFLLKFKKDKTIRFKVSTKSNTIWYIIQRFNFDQAPLLVY